MTSPLFSFTYAAKHLPGVATGETIRYGAILKDAASGKIIGHLQETGALENVLGGLSNFTPFASPITGGVAVIQNIEMSRRLQEIQSTLGLVQGLQAAALATSVISLGVTLASTAYLSQKMGRVISQVDELGRRVEMIPAVLRNNSLRNTLDQILHALQRIREAEYRQSGGAELIRRSEEDLDEGFRRLVFDAAEMAREEKIDPELLRSILAGLALASDAIARILLQTEGPVAARETSVRHFERFLTFSEILPPDVLREKLHGSAQPEVAGLLCDEIRELRRLFATRPVFHETLHAHGADSREFIKRAKEEPEEPFLFVPAKVSGSER